MSNDAVYVEPPRVTAKAIDVIPRSVLNSKYIFPVFHEADYFNVDPFLKPSNQRVLVSCMYLTWNLSCISPRMNVAFTSIT